MIAASGVRHVAGLTIYEHRESVCCHKIAICLAEKAITCDVVNISLEENEQKAPWFLAINPAGKVPALVHDGRVVTQSSIMTEYLDDAFPTPSLMPFAPYDRAQRRLWARRIDDDMHAHVSTISFNIAFATLLRRRMDTPAKIADYLASIADPKTKARAKALFASDLRSPAMRAALASYVDFLEDMEQMLEGSPWLAGADYSLADIDVIPYVWRLANLQLDFLWAGLPRVTDWLRRMTARPAFAAAIVAPALPEWIETMRSTGRDAAPVLRPIVDELAG